MTLFILGLDGASIANLEAAMARIQLTNFRKVLAGGESSDLQSVYPCVTGPAWTSIFSGVNPGKHGIFDQFTYRGSELVPSNMRQSAVPFLWDYLTWARKRILVMGVPFIYPAPKINGVFVTGTFCPRVSSYPGEIAEKYDLSGFEYGEVTAEQAFEKILTKRSSWSRTVIEGLQKRTKVASELIDSEPWDVVILVDALPDEIFHIGGGDEALENESFLGLDRLVGMVLSRMRAGDELLVISDHGFSPLKGVLFINEWLRRKNYLVKRESTLTKALSRLGFSWDLFSRPGPASTAYAFALEHFPGPLNRLTGPLRRDMLLPSGGANSESRAIAFNSGGPVAWIRVNGAHGQTSAEAERSLIVDLQELVEAGLVKNVLRVSDLYSGRQLPRSPGTLLVESEDGLAIDARRIFARDVIGKPLLTKVADHRMQGVLLHLGPSSLRAGQKRTVYDITPTALALLGIPAPSYLDGRDLFLGSVASPPRLNVPKSL